MTEHSLPAAGCSRVQLSTSKCFFSFVLFHWPLVFRQQTSMFVACPGSSSRLLSFASERLPSFVSLELYLYWKQLSIYNKGGEGEIISLENLSQVQLAMVHELHLLHCPLALMLPKGFGQIRILANPLRKWGGDIWALTGREGIAKVRKSALDLAPNFAPCNTREWGVSANAHTFLQHLSR